MTEHPSTQFARPVEASPPAPGADGSRSRIALLLIVCAQFLIILDSSIVTVALPNIQHSLHFTAVGVQGVVTAYNVAFAGALILGGRVGDMVGRRRMFWIGMVAFALTSLLCGLAVNATMLIVARALQGFSAAVIAPTALALLTTTFPEGPVRNRAMSTFSVATVLGFVGGLVLSGPLVDWLGWPSVFYVAVPVGLVVAALAPRYVNPVPARRSRIDVLGAVLVTAAVAVIVIAPGQGATHGWASARFLLTLAAGLVLLGAFVLVETRAAEPLVRLGFFRVRTVRAANAVTLIGGAMNGAGYLLLTLYLQEVLHYTPIQAGLAVAPTGVANVLLGRVAGKLVTRFGVRTMMTVATAVGALSIAALALFLRPHQSYGVLVVPIVLMGMCFLMTTVSATIGAVAGVSNAEQGLAGGLRQTSLQLGIALGVAAFVSVAASRTASVSGGAHPMAADAALVSGFQVGLLALAAFALLAALIAWAGFRPARSRV
ncbi:MFS transporter [Dactylosporangium matsuzakiense]|uniref:MFS transporter n=1 Tax=Dactylosporangium matsuzakiense TaxID=53360 RepID=A0A9W6KQ46_9ACTN|nr:MFS transporter [Dactylosporangium matsuzakiense]UWZ40880.1 MFS transporter [Dactylosporangium matsuzakiense]GLL03489.1 MFS transporter [Dactylosporangium matsuzakiense]